MRSWPTWRGPDGKPSARCRPGTWPDSGPGARTGATRRKPPARCARAWPISCATWTSPVRSARIWPGGSRRSAIPGAVRRHPIRGRLRRSAWSWTRSTGKRDYAMVLLTARLGLRVGDLRCLELSWFDWRAKTLTLTQHKTGVALRLPVPGDVGWAVIDYIRHGRPEAGCAQVFVKHRYPFTAFGSSSSAGCRLRYYARRAGILFSAGRSHGLHSLRSALAVAMLQADTPPPVGTAVLGHAAATTTAAHYLRLDTEHLRGCALDVEDVLAAGQGARS